MVRWLPSAARDLSEIEEWIADRNVLAAIDTIDAMLRAIDRLEDHPNLGRAGRVQTTRELPVVGTPFVVVYRVEVEHVAIVRLLHGARRWPPT